MWSSLRISCLITLWLFCAAAICLAQGRHPSSNVPATLVQQLINDINTNDNHFLLSEHDLVILKQNLICERQDLNSDGVPEYFLYIDHHDWCGAGRNCDYWVYQETTGGYTLLLHDKQLRVKRHITNGYRDLISETPMGVMAPNKFRIHATLYKFDGQEYKAVSSHLMGRAVKKKG